MFCQQQVAEFRPHVEGLRKAGIEVVVIGSGSPFFAKGFQERMDVPELTIYCDEKLVSYEEAGMERSLKSMLNPMMLVKGAKAGRKYPQKKVMGDAKQQGGAVIIKPDGTIAWRHANRYPGDHAPNETIVAEALKALG
jgi:peroxiredoxin